MHIDICDVILPTVVYVCSSSLLLSNVDNLILSLYIGHHCEYPGCGQVLVLDGNLKDVCAATEAGFIQYSSFPNSTIKTGCQISPLQSSSYCFLHAPRVCKRSTSTGSAVDTQEKEKTACEDDIVNMIVGKKTTRNTTYYKVL